MEFDQVLIDRAALRLALKRLVAADTEFWASATADAEDIGGQAERLSDATDELNSARRRALRVLEETG